MKRWRGRLRKLAIWAGGAVALYAVVGFLIVPPIVRSQLETKLGELAGRKVVVESVRINPFALTAAVRGFALKELDGSADAVSFEELRFNIATSSVFRLGVIVESVQLSKPYVRIVRRTDGRYSFQDIADRFAAVPSEPQPEASGPARFAVYNIVLSDGRVEFDDQPDKTQHVVSDIQVGLPFVSSLPREVDVVVQPRLSAKVNGTPFEIAGETKPFKDTRETTLRIDIDDLEVAKYLAYVPLRIRVPSGRLTTRLVLSSAAGAGNQLQTLTLAGTASLQRLAIQDSGGGPLAALGRLSVDLESLDLLERRAAVKAVRIEAPEVDIVRQKDGSLNVSSAFAPAPGAAPARPAESREPPFAPSVADIALLNGQVRFTDLTTAKPVRVALNDLSMSLAGLSSAPDSRATLKLNGRVNKSAPLEVAGKLNPLAGDLALDLTASARDIDLAPLSPYSAMYAGYDIGKGKLSLRHAYKIEKRQLTGDNSIRLDQFTFGSRVDSPTATKLPVVLAVSLLKDRNGVINVSLPISGSLGDPQFTVRTALAQESGQLLDKAASSPFALLGGEELAFVEFAPGSAKLDAAGEAKLQALAKALYERPGLRLEASGRALPDADSAELMRASGKAAVSEEDFLKLAQSRAQAARDWLLEGGKLPAERVSLADPKLGAEGAQDPGKATRVDFALR